MSVVKKMIDICKKDQKYADIDIENIILSTLKKVCYGDDHRALMNRNVPVFETYSVFNDSHFLNKTKDVVRDSSLFSSQEKEILEIFKDDIFSVDIFVKTSTKLSTVSLIDNILNRNKKFFSFSHHNIDFLKKELNEYEYEGVEKLKKIRVFCGAQNKNNIKHALKDIKTETDLNLFKEKNHIKGYYCRTCGKKYEIEKLFVDFL